MIPIGDADSTRRGMPVVTLLLIAVNVVVFLLEMGQGQNLNQFIQAYGTVPYEVTHGQDIGPPGPHPIYLTLFTSMFLHANWMHIGGNMLFLWVFGSVLEGRIGSGRFVLLYFLCGLAADGAQILMSPSSTMPGIGASGAIAGVMGAFILLFPRDRIRTLGRYGVYDVPAWMMLGIWFLTQILAGAGQWGGKEVGGVAYAAHVGGFVAGLILIKLLAAGAPRGASGYAA